MASRYGTPGLPIRDLYLRAALDLLVQAGVRVQSQRTVQPKTFENTITKRLNGEMNGIKKAQGSDSPWHEMTWDYRVNTSSDPSDPLKEGEIDIKFRWWAIPAVNEHYLAVEAKKLYGTGTSRADAYVTAGVMDFVTGKYARDHSHGIMLGYVVVGPLANAIEAVKDAMASRRIRTAECAAFSLDSSLCAHTFTHHSTHIQRSTTIPITLVHVFLDLI